VYCDEAGCGLRSFVSVVDGIDDRSRRCPCSHDDGHQFNNDRVHSGPLVGSGASAAPSWFGSKHASFAVVRSEADSVRVWPWLLTSRRLAVFRRVGACATLRGCAAIAECLPYTPESKRNHLLPRREIALSRSVCHRLLGILSVDLCLARCENFN